MKVYLDACCLNRPFDDQSQPRIHLETEAILLVLEKIHRREWQWVASDALFFEINQNPDAENRQRVRALLSDAREVVGINDDVLSRAEYFEQSGLDVYDALHLAIAELSSVDVLLTTDDRFIKLVQREESLTTLQVANPVRWLEEVLLDE
jgi:predicted nucleic acid-binding protein